MVIKASTYEYKKANSAFCFVCLRLVIEQCPRKLQASTHLPSKIQDEVRRCILYYCGKKLIIIET